MTTLPHNGPLASRLLAEMSGTILENRYALGRVLGSGGMGAVFEARHVRLGRPVAIKVLLPSFAADEEYVERFLREAKAASKISHPNVVGLLDYGETADGLAYSVMEFLVGRDLQQLLDAEPEGRLPWERACGLLSQIATGLQAAHHQGVIHRDIKPANCFVTEAGGEPVVKLVDFGIAKLEGPGRDYTLTHDNQLLGTPSYIAPEMVRSNQPATPLSDIYSFGTLAYRMLVGKTPFSGETITDLLLKVWSDPVPHLREQVPEIPPDVETFVLRMLAKSPAERPADMKEVIVQLMSLGSQKTLTTATEVLELPAGGRLPIATASHALAGTARVPMSDPVSAPDRPRKRGRLWILLTLGPAGVLLIAGALVVSGMLDGSDKKELAKAEAADALASSTSVEYSTQETSMDGYGSAAVIPATMATAVEISATESADQDGEDAMLEDGRPKDTDGTEIVEPERPEIKTKHSRKHTKIDPKEPLKPPKDPRVASQLMRKIAKRCSKELSGGSVTMKFMITPKGEVLGLNARNSVEECAKTQIEGTKFRTRSKSTALEITVE